MTDFTGLSFKKEPMIISSSALQRAQKENDAMFPLYSGKMFSTHSESEPFKSENLSSYAKGYGATKGGHS